MEIRKFQKSCKLLLPKAPFFRLVKEVMQYVSPYQDLKIQSEALSALQEVNLNFLNKIFIKQLLIKKIKINFYLGI